MIPMYPPKKADYLDELDDFLGWCKANKVTIRDGKEYLPHPDLADAATRIPAKPEDQEPAQ